MDTNKPRMNANIKSRIITSLFFSFSLLTTHLSAGPQVISTINLKSQNATLSNPVPITVNPVDGKVFVAGIRSTNILKFDPVTKKVEGEIKPLSYIWNLAVHNNNLYATGFNSNWQFGIHIYDTNTLQFIETIPSLNGWIFSMRTDVAGDILYYGTWGRLYAINLSNKTQTLLIDFGSWNHCVSCINIDTARNRLYLTVYDYNAAQARVVVFDLTTRTIISNISIGSNPFSWDMRYDAAYDGVSKLFITQMYRSEITVVDVVNNSVINIPDIAWPQKLTIDNTKKRLYVVDNYTDKFHIIDTQTLKLVKQFSPGDDPSGVCVDIQRNRVYTANYWSHDIGIVDTVTETLIERIPFVANSPLDVSITDDKLYVSNGQSGGILVVDKNSYLLIDKIIPYSYTDVAGMFLWPSGVLNIFTGEIKTDQKFAYTVDKFNNSIAVFDIIDGKFARHISPLGQATAVTKDDTNLYIAHTDTDRLNLDIVTNSEITARIPLIVGGLSYGLEINKKTQKIYVADYNNNQIIVVNLLNKTIKTKIPTAPYPACVTVDELSNTIYVTNYGADCISVIDGETDTLLGYLPVGGNPWGISVNPLSKRVYVVNTLDKTLSVINAKNNTVVATLDVGDGARYVRCDIPAQRVYIPNQLDQTITVVEDLVDIIPPAKVQGLTVEVVPEGNTLKLSWQANTDDDLAGYRLYRDNVLIATLTETSYIDKGLTDGKGYTYHVTAIDEVPNESVKSDEVIGIPKDSVPPAPPSNLIAKVDQQGKVKFTWATSEDVAKHNIYCDNSSGEIDYTKPIATVEHPITEWTSDILVNNRTYKFGIRAVDEADNEEKNTDVVASITVRIDGKATAIIKVPTDSKRIRGNAVTIMADATENTTGVLFQYRPASGEWTDITSIDKKYPYSVYWNVSALPNGEYKLRVVAYDENNLPDLEPPYITVFVDDVNPDIVEDGNPNVDPNTPARLKPHTKKEKITDKKDTEVALADGTKARIRAASFAGTKTLVIEVIPPTEIASKLPPPESSLKPIGIFRKFYFTDGTRKFERNISLSIPYPDENEDGIVDGTNIHESKLKIYYLNETNNRWEEIKTTKQFTTLRTFDTATGATITGNSVEIETDHFTIFGLFYETVAETLSNLIVYPNPYIPNDGNPVTGLPGDKIKFDGLTQQAKVQIFTITGKLVWEKESLDTTVNPIEWNIKTREDEEVVSGVYLYLVTNNKGEKQKGKLAIIK